MSDIAIKVENLSKRYRIGLEEEVPDTMSGALLNFLKQPGRNLRQLRRLTRFGENGQEPEDIIWALKDVSFEVKRGEVVGVIGRNGAGKSTLLKILSRITHPTSGRIELNGRVSSLLEVGTGFHPELTGRENVYLNGTILGMRKSEIDQKFDEIVSFSGVAKFIDTPVKRYSSGMRVRLAFSVAAHLEPEILLIDEVLAVGDLEFQKKCLGKMEQVSQAGRTVLFVSHNMSSVQNLCRSVMILENGVTVASGKPEQMIQMYVKLNQPKSQIGYPIKRKFQQSIFQFTQLVFQDSHGNVRDSFAADEEITVILTCEVSAPIDKVVIGLTVRTIHGQKVFNIRSEDAGHTFSFNPGSHRIKVKFNVDRFLSNSFYVDLGAMSGSAGALDLCEHAGRFSVTASDPSGFGKTRQQGEIVYVPSRWLRLMHQ